MIPHHSPAGRFLMVTVPEKTETKMFFIHFGNLYTNVRHIGKPFYKKLPPGNYSIVGLASELTWGKKGEICESEKTFGWRNYTAVNGQYQWCGNREQSFDSLLKHHSLDPKTTLILKQIK